MLLVPLAGLDLDKATEIVNKWPSPPDNSGEAGEEVRSNLQNEFRDRVASSLAYRDPEQVLALVRESGTSNGSEYYIHARAAEYLLDKGHEDEALKLVDETMADFAVHGSDPQTIEGSANFVGELANIDPDRFLSALALLAGSETVAPGDGGSLQIGNRIIQLTYTEAKILGVISSIGRRPWLTRIKNSQRQ